MSTTSLRKSKFYACFYGDAVPEKEFYGKDLCVSFEGESAVFSLRLMQLLDVASFTTEAENFDTFVLENRLLVAALVRFLQGHPELKFYKLHINAQQYRIASLKIGKGFVRLGCF
jgi:hypothetical protein